jgi:hypothetical protein
LKSGRSKRPSSKITSEITVEQLKEYQSMRLGMCDRETALIELFGLPAVALHLNRFFRTFVQRSNCLRDIAGQHSRFEQFERGATVHHVRLLPPPAFLQNPQSQRVALVMATVPPLAVIAWAILRPRKALLVSVLFLECILLVNAGWHIFTAWVRGGYASGVITAVLINLPFGFYVLRRVVKEGWIPSRTVWQLIGMALMLHIAALGSLSEAKMLR